MMKSKEAGKEGGSSGGEMRIQGAQDPGVISVSAPPLVTGSLRLREQQAALPSPALSLLCRSLSSVIFFFFCLRFYF